MSRRSSGFARSCYVDESMGGSSARAATASKSAPTEMGLAATSGRKTDGYFFHSLVADLVGTARDRVERAAEILEQIPALQSKIEDARASPDLSSLGC